MTDRLLYPEEYEPLPNTRLSAFVRANGLDPFDIVAAHPLILEGGRLTTIQFVREEHPGGTRRKVLDPATDSYVKRSVTVPLISPPEDHGL